MIGGDEQFVDFAVIVENERPAMAYAVYLSPSIDNTEWEQRIALNGYLLGLDRASFKAEQVSRLTPPPKAYQWGPWARDPAERARRIARAVGFLRRGHCRPVHISWSDSNCDVALPFKGLPPAYLSSLDGSVSKKAPSGTSGSEMLFVKRLETLPVLSATPRLAFRGKEKQRSKRWLKIAMSLA